MSSITTPLVLSNSFIPTNYKLDLKIVPSKPNFQGQLVIDLVKNTNCNGGVKDLKDEEEEFSLQFHSVNTIITTAFFENDQGHSAKLKVVLDRSLGLVTLLTSDQTFRNLASFKINLNYVGKISNIKTYQDLTAGVFKTNYLNGLTGKLDNYIISTHCQPKFARLIFPCIDELSCKATYELSITTDIKFTCISNTALEDVEIIDDVSKIVKFQKSPPMSTSIFGFVVGDLEYVEQLVQLKESDQFPIRVYTPIGELEKASYSLNIAALALPIVESMMGYPYPLQKLDFVALPFLTDSAMEDWGLIKIQQSFLLISSEMINKLEYSSAADSLREVVCHEIIHQWVGNTITFDDWSHLWLNESFATFMAYAVLQKMGLNPRDEFIWETKCATDLARMMENDSLYNANPIFVGHAIEVKTTQDALNQESYYKGIPLLRMLANLFNEKSDDHYEMFFQIVGQFINSIKFGSFKPIDLWNFITKSPLNSNKYDVSTFMHSWTRLPGHPILKVTANKESNTIEITQHRYIYQIKVEDGDEFEDVPYHVPITCRLSDGTISRQLLNDRTKTLDIDVASLLTINANYCNLDRVQYCSEIYSNIALGIRNNKLTSLDLLAIVTDLNMTLGQSYQTDDELIGLLEIAEAYLASNTVIDFRSLNLILNMIQNLTSSVQLVNGDSNLKLINKLNIFSSKLVLQLKGKLLWDNSEFDYTKLNVEELQSRNSILMMGNKFEPIEFQPIIKQLYKNLTHGPKESIPKEMLNGILCGTLIQSGQQKIYKEVLALAKAPTLIINNVIKHGSSESEIRGALQTAAVLSLGYVSQPDLVLKTLNFVMTNIDSKLIELSLIGLQEQPALRQQLWDWYTLHYNTWCLKTYREGSAYSKQMKATLTNITKIILAMMINNVRNMKKVNAFVEEKMSSSLYQRFDLKEILDTVKMENDEKVKLGTHNEALLQWLSNC